MNPTCDPSLKSWIPVSADSDFPIQNLPFGVFRRRSGEVAVGVAIGDHVLDLSVLHGAGHFSGTPVATDNVFARTALNDFVACGRAAGSAVRAVVSSLLAEGTATLRDNATLRKQTLLPQSDVEMLLPTQVGNYVDFYSSKEHATNVGSMFRDPSNPLLPNWVHIPVGYNGRASSVIVSGIDVRRPRGQTKADDADAPTYGPCRLLDFELEMGFITGSGNELGTQIPIDRAADHIAGMVLVNDWSARDIQKWEYVPLGPFLGKTFATSISPWLVTLDALDPFRVPGPRQDPPPLPYLQFSGDWAYDMQLEVWLQAADMNEPVRLTKTNFRYMYWNMLQQLAHMTVNGTNVLPGDLYGSGTVSGPTEDSRGSMLEICWKGTKPLTLPNGQQRRFLADGDTIIMRGWCQGDGHRIGFGELRSTILPATG